MFWMTMCIFVFIFIIRARKKLWVLILLLQILLWTVWFWSLTAVDSFVIFVNDLWFITNLVEIGVCIDKWLRWKSLITFCLISRQKATSGRCWNLWLIFAVYLFQWRMDHFRFSSVVTLSGMVIPEDKGVIWINTYLRFLSAVLLVANLLGAVHFRTAEVRFFISWGDFLVLRHRLFLFEWDWVLVIIVMILLMIIVVVSIVFKITVIHSILILVYNNFYFKLHDSNLIISRRIELFKLFR